MTTTTTTTLNLSQLKSFVERVPMRGGGVGRSPRVRPTPPQIAPQANAGAQAKGTRTCRIGRGWSAAEGFKPARVEPPPGFPRNCP